MSAEQLPSDSLLQRLRQWGDTSWIHQLGIGDILREQHKLAKDVADAADEIQRLTRERDLYKFQAETNKGIINGIVKAREEEIHAMNRALTEMGNDD